MLIHLFVSVPRNDYLDEDKPDDEGIQGMPDDVGIPDFPEEDIPICPIPSQPSRFPSSTGSPRPGPANQSYAPPELHARLEHGQDDVPGGWSESG